MPVCRTCRGEYARLECLCPSCGEPLGRGSNLCHLCGSETGGKRLCPRCKSDVSAWERESFPLNQFLMRGGALGLLPSLVAILAWIFFWLPRDPTLHHPGIMAVAVGLSQLVVIILYVKRLFWWERAWATQSYRAYNIPLVGAIGGAFLLAILFGVFAFTMHKAWVAPFTPWQMLAFGAAYALTYVTATAALTLLAIQDYVDRLDERVPQPLFVHTQHQLRVVLDTALETLNILNGAEVQDGGTVHLHDRRYEVLEVLRVTESGGIRVALREYKRVERPDSSDVMRIRWVESTWRIEADRWARIFAIEPVRHRTTDVTPVPPPKA